MPGKTRGRKPHTMRKDGPVKPGSPLHRLLEMIAHEIVKDLNTDRSRENLRRKKR